MYRSPCLSRQQGKDRAFLRLGKHTPSGALAQSCRLPADATGGVFSPCRLLVTLDRQPEPEVLMASSALSIKEDILAALKDILMRHLPAPEIRPADSRKTVGGVFVSRGKSVYLLTLTQI